MHPVRGQDATGVIDVDNPTATVLDAAVAMASATFVAAAQPSGGPDDDDDGECRLMGSFALVIQAALGGLALLSLVYKRWRERPQRPVKIWFFDVSKQVFGSVLVHIANIFMSMLTSGRFSVQVEPGARLMARADEYIPNPCSFYLLNLGIDTTIGIPILLVLLKITTGLVAMTPWGKPAESIQSGYYGNPPSAYWWLKQSVIYFIGLFGMKICVLLIFIILPWISKVGDWALGWTAGNEKLQIAFVMMIFPLIMNGLQYYIIDSFIKEKKSAEHERLPDEDPDETQRLHRDDAEDGEELLTSSEDEDEEHAKKAQKQSFRGNRDAHGQQQHEEYDPSKDGDAGTVVGSSSSSGQFEVDKPGPPELYPKE